MAVPLQRLALLTLVLTACGGGPSGGGTPTPSPDPTPAPGPAPSPSPAPSPAPTPTPGACAKTISPLNVPVPTRLENTSAACDYLIQGYINVTSALKIDPGTVIRFGQDAEMYISDGGMLEAVGTPTARIRLEGLNKTKGYWDGLSFNGARPSRIEYTDIESAGQTGYLKNYAAVSGIDGTLAFRNNTVSGSYANGMTISGVNRLYISEFANNVFYDNVGFGLRVSAQQTSVLDAGSDYLGQSRGLPNGVPYVKVDWDDVYDDTTWHKLNIPYYVSIALYFKGGLLTVEPGVEVVMEAGATFNVHGGALRAVGTPQAPIVFRGEQAERGSWDGIDFFYSRYDENVMKHVRVLSGGGGKGANVYVGNGSSLNISDSHLAGSSGWGVCLDSIDFGNAYATVDIGPGMTYENNAQGNVNLECE